ncbi:hypothetical protein [Streptosporangium sp. NPDC002721]|uniref:hypothetical protein n=1 Tax=Streptosporangium sp. NPDC002721 TaxID=3366188 RepID=UPI003682C488
MEFAYRYTDLIYGTTHTVRATDGPGILAWAQAQLQRTITEWSGRDIGGRIVYRDQPGTPWKPITATPAPGGCRWCGVDKQQHVRRYHSDMLDDDGNPVAGHFWTAPPQDVIKQRMLARRAARASSAPRWYRADVWMFSGGVWTLYCFPVAATCDATAYAAAVDHVNGAYPGCFRYVTRLGLHGSHLPAEPTAKAER